ncbi:MAG: hypothetical protein EOO38_32025 [Cytophagaceae bacterium]|nr:MAG: hypothetical protein EOO38_32025 [Cytophagaceae bacterium]
MGRKGIGKLSLFSLADTVEVHSVKDGQKCALRMSAADIFWLPKLADCSS